MIPLYKVFMPNDIDIGLSDVIKSQSLAYGTQSIDFENKVKNFIGNKNFISVSGNSILFALQVLGLKAGDEVIMSPMSCLISSQPVALIGATVVWCDIDPNTGTLNPDSLKSLISPRTKAVIHYHWGGNPGYINEINQIAHSFGIPVIEDALESFGAEYCGKVIGNHDSDIVCFSFTPVRIPNVIDGGGLTFCSEALYEKAVRMRDLGINRDSFRDQYGELSENSDVSIAGNSQLLNNVCGFIGSMQMNHIEILLNKHRSNAELWHALFADTPKAKPLSLTSQTSKPSYWVYTLLAENRNGLFELFRDNGFAASKMHLRNDVYSVFGTKNLPLRGVEEFSNRQLNIPCGWWVNNSDIKLCLDI